MEKEKQKQAEIIILKWYTWKPLIFSPNKKERWARITMEDIQELINQFK